MSLKKRKRKRKKYVGGTNFELFQSGSEKGVFWKRGLFTKIHFLEILENLEILEILENPRRWKIKENPAIF